MKNFLIFIFIEFTLGQVFYPNQTKIFYKYYDNYEIADTKHIPVEIPDWDVADDS